MKVNNRKLWVLILFCVGIALVSCEDSFTPKPRGFNRIDLPPQEYHVLDTAVLPYSFEYSSSAKIYPDTTGYFEKHWIDIQYPYFGANIQITYYPLKKNRDLLFELINDSYKLTAKHQVKATSIEEMMVTNNAGHTGKIFMLEGEVPSQAQFIITDSTDHFLRGALYFRMADKNDSLAPVIAFIRRDILQLVKSTDWKPLNQSQL